MKFAFVLFKYFPYGGLEQNCIRILRECKSRGHEVDVYTMKWEEEDNQLAVATGVETPYRASLQFMRLQGAELKDPETSTTPLPAGAPLRASRVMTVGGHDNPRLILVPYSGWSNHARCLSFSKNVQSLLAAQSYDAILGFNRMPGLDVYYAADVCYAEDIQHRHGAWYRWTSRYRVYAELERSVFSLDAKTQIMLISEQEQHSYQKHYHTPSSRFYLLPPGIPRNPFSFEEMAAIRERYRRMLDFCGSCHPCVSRDLAGISRDSCFRRNDNGRRNDNQLDVATGMTAIAENNRRINHPVGLRPPPLLWRGISEGSTTPPASRASLRASRGIAAEIWLLFVGSSFKRKGLDRVIRGIASLPLSLRSSVRLFVIGQDRSWKYQWLAKMLGISDRVVFLGSRDDVDSWLLSADLLVHPARQEAAGMVLLEALVMGLPVLTTSACGFAPHIEKAQAGRVLEEPFHQESFNRALQEIMLSPEREKWKKNAVHYAETQDLYSRAEKAVDFLERVAKEKKKT